MTATRLNPLDTAWLFTESRATPNHVGGLLQFRPGKAHGRVVLDAPVESLAGRFVQLIVAPAQLDAARALQPFHEREVFGRFALTFEGRTAAELAAYGETRTPSIADLFVARMQGMPS